MESTQPFLDKLHSDPAFAEKIKSCTSASEIIAAAQAEGIEISGPDIAKAMAHSAPKLSDEELSSVTTDTVMAAALIK